MDDSGDVHMSFSKSSVREKKGVVWYIHIIGYSTIPVNKHGIVLLEKGARREMSGISGVARRQQDRFPVEFMWCARPGLR